MVVLVIGELFYTDDVVVMTMRIVWMRREDCIQAVGGLRWEGEYAIQATQLTQLTTKQN